MKSESSSKRRLQLRGGCVGEEEECWVGGRGGVERKCWVRGRGEDQVCALGGRGK